MPSLDIEPIKAYPSQHYEFAVQAIAPERVSSIDDEKVGISLTLDGTDNEAVERTEFPNIWFKIRYRYNLREYFAEFLGTMLVRVVWKLCVALRG